MKIFDWSAFMKMGLGKKFAIPTVVLVVVGLGASMLVSYGSSRRAIEDASMGQITQIAGSTAQLIVNWIGDRKLNLISWSEQEVFKTAVQEGFIAKAARKSADARFVRLQTDYPYLEQIALADAKGQIVAASDMGLKERNVADRQYFQEALKGEVVIGDVEKSALSERPVFFMSVSVKGTEQIEGVLFCAVDMTYFNKTFVETVEVGQTGYAYIYQEDGFVIAHPDKSNVLKLNMKEFDFGREMMAKESGTIVYTFKGVEKIVAYLKLKELGWTVGIGAVTSELLAPVRRVGYVNLIIALTVTAFLAVAVLGMLRLLALRPISRVASGLRDIAQGEGDLTTRLEVGSQDEVGELARWFNTFMETLQDMVKDIAANATALSTSSSGLSTLSDQMASSAEEMTLQSDSVAGSADEMSGNINTIATAAEEMSANVQNVSSTAEEMSHNVHAVASSVEEMSMTLSDVAGSAREGSDIAGKAMEMSNAALETMNVLGRAAKDIGEVTALIKRIAEQTNLLALNATIEAASAGDAGKGFAVVANEIKELANQSAQAAEDIAKRIDGVQTNAEEAVKVIADVSGVINNINESSLVITKSVEQQKLSANEISSNVHQTSTGINDIASSIAEVAKGANDMAREAAEAAKGVTEVSSNIQEVSRATGDSNTGAQRVSSSAKELTKVAAELQKLVGRFRV